jgi:hypothetical protein
MIPFSWPHRRAAGTAGRRALISHDPRGRERSAASPITRASDSNHRGIEAIPGREIHRVLLRNLTAPGALTREERTRPSRHS